MGSLLLIAIALGGVLFVALFGWSLFVATPPAGFVGIQDTFGDVSPVLVQPGFNFKNPVTTVYYISLQTQKYIDYGKDDKVTITALSNDGLTTTMGIAVNYHLNEDKVIPLYRKVGLNYMNVVLVNPIHSVPRDLISKYDTKTLYSASQAGSTDRAKLEQELLRGIQEKLETIGVPGSITIEQVFIRDIDFPQDYKNTITSKMNMDTDKQKKATEVELQRLEAQRQVVEAEGKANANIALAKGEAEANRIRTASLSEVLLKYIWIQNIKENDNAMYIQTGEDGTPVSLVKNIDKTAG